MEFVDWFMVFVLFIIGLGIGYFYGKEKGKKEFLGTEAGATVVSINKQLAEIKTKFEDIEKAREEREKLQEKLQVKKEESLAQLLESTRKNEQDRLGQVQQMVDQIRQFLRIFSGVQTRGKTGEHILKRYIKDQIKNNVVVTNTRLGRNLVVEFAWKLADGKYLPIDSKCHDVVKLVKKLEEKEDVEEQEKIKKKIIQKVKKGIDEVKKYQNLSKTPDFCIAAIPDVVFDLVPETSSYAISQNVYLTSYSNVGIISYLIATQYDSDLEKGDVKQLERLVKSLMRIVEEINKKTNTIDKGLKTIKNANDAISNEVGKAKGLKYR